MEIQPSKTFAGSDLGMTDQWNEYIDTLNWGPGHRDESSFNAFLRAGSLKIAQQKAIDEVAARIKKSGGTFNEKKLLNQLRRAYDRAQAGQENAITIIRPPKATFDPDRLKELAGQATGITYEWLRSRSPIPPKDRSSAEFLEAVYDVGEKVLIFEDLHSQGEHLFEIGSEQNPKLPKYTGPGVWFLANPVDGVAYPNPRQENKPSRRSEESVTSWRYLVLESDVATPDLWLPALVQLPLQITAIYTSGGKSIHALVRLDANSKTEWDQMRDQMKPVLVTLGADENAMTAVRLTRLPGAKRGTELQELLYLNPIPTPEPIIKKSL